MALPAEQTNPLFHLADEFVAVRDELGHLEARVKELNQRKEEIEQRLIDIMRTEEVEKFTRNGYTFFPSVKTYASLRADAKEYGIHWLKENGYGDLVKEQVNTQSLSSLYREWEENGEIPEDFLPYLSIHEKITVNVRKGRK